MWEVFRWTAGFLLMVMLAPTFEPLAMACAAQPEAMHCMRQSVRVDATQPAMPCHHAMAQSKPPQPESSETSFQAINNDSCCPNHCCCGATTSEWAQPASSLLSCLSLLIEPACQLQSAVIQSRDISGHDSARAPPRS
ncbi:MAG: hypothetical protein ABR861_03235 [Terriglobales bacterium]|jgi:hypothetical protein